MRQKDFQACFPGRLVMNYKKKKTEKHDIDLQLR